MSFPKLQALMEAKKEPNHDECVKFVEGWAQGFGDVEEMAEEGASFTDIMRQFWDDVDDDSDRKAEARKIGLTKTLAREIMWNTLDNMDIELGRRVSEEKKAKDEMELDFGDGEVAPEEDTEEKPAVDKAAVLAFLKSCDAKCRADVCKKLQAMVEKDKEEAESVNEMQLISEDFMKQKIGNVKLKGPELEALAKMCEKMSGKKFSEMTLIELRDCLEKIADADKEKYMMDIMQMAHDVSKFVKKRTSTASDGK